VIGRGVAPSAGILAAAVVSAAAFGCRHAAPARAELIVRGFTLERPAGRATALAVRDGRVVAIGDEAAVAPHRGEGTLELDLKGAGIAPGLADAHADLLAIGERLMNEASGDGLYLDLSDAETEEEIVQRSRARARVLGPGAWILGRDWDETRWVDKHPPDKRLLSDIVGANPALLVRRGGGSVWANKQALDRAGLEGSGLVSGPGVTALLRRATPLSAEERQQAIGAALAVALSRGVTRVEAVARAGRLGLDDPEASTDTVFGPWILLARAGRLGARIALLVPAPSPAAEALLRDGPEPFEVPERLEARTLLVAAQEPPEALAPLCRRAAERGLAVAITAAGAGTGAAEAMRACAAARGAASSPAAGLRLELPARLDADEPALLKKNGVLVILGPAEDAAALVDGLRAAKVTWRRGSGDQDRFAFPAADAATGLEPGDPADFVVLGGQAVIDATWVAGREVYRRGR
jgi:hypothetical protein